MVMMGSSSAAAGPRCGQNVRAEAVIDQADAGEGAGLYHRHRVALPLETLSGFTVCQLPLFNLCNT